MTTNQLAQIGLTIHEHWPGAIADAAKGGQRTADVACGLLEELNARQHGRDEPFRVSDMPIRETVNEKRSPLPRGQSRAGIVREVIANIVGQFTAVDVVAACSGSMDIRQPDVGAVIARMTSKGRLRKVTYGVYERA